MQCFIHVKSGVREKIWFSPLRNFHLLYYSVTIAVTAPYYPIPSLLSVKWSLTAG